MPNPQKTVRYSGLGHHATTHATDGSITYAATQPFGTAVRHAPVKITDDGTVGLAGAGDEVIGSLTRVEGDDFAVVDDGQYVKFRGEPAIGSAVVGAASNNVAAGTDGAGKGEVVAVGAGSEAGAGYCIVKMY